MVTPTEYGLALAAVILLLATLYLIYFFFRFTVSILS